VQIQLCLDLREQQDPQVKLEQLGHKEMLEQLVQLDRKVKLEQRVQLDLLEQRVQAVLIQPFLALREQRGLQVQMVVQQAFLNMQPILQAQLADQVQVIFVGVMQLK
jgi:hypothetical protein